ncbi:ParB N-terminal domain-containing protein [Brevibacillus sp. NPDC058079]|uniref:ParB N-terminal domain-containing protein n=1 Tax=Brevibacillus sp. NPDC058079 TaxID=3346330 RepID=UPI0036E2EA7D
MKRLLEPWRINGYTKAGMVKELPISWVEQFIGKPILKTVQAKETLKEDIERNGLKNPIVLLVGQKDRRLRIKTGHTRLAIYKEIGYDSIPVICEVVSEIRDMYWGYTPNIYPLMSRMRKDDGRFSLHYLQNPKNIFDDFVLLSEFQKCDF